MSDGWRQYKPKLALYGILQTPGGLSVDDAMKRANTALDGHRAKASQAMGEALTKLEAIAQAREPDCADRCYELAAFVLEIAGILQPPLCRAAGSLCELVMRMKAAGKWDWPSVDVHVATMRLMSTKYDDADPTVQTVLKGLGAIVVRFPDPSPPGPQRPR